MTDPDVVVVGAGAAGIAAARFLTDAGRSCVVLEAGRRVGGRAFTDGYGFDHGASWLHSAAHNPLVPLARTLRVETVRDTGPQFSFVGGRRAGAREIRAHRAATRALYRAAARAAGGPDVAVDAIAPRGGFWDATVAHLEGTIIGAAEFEHTSLHDWWANTLEGANLMPSIGMGRLVTRLAEGLPITLDAPVTRIGWDGPITVEGPRGTLRPAACLVTVSTGVLAAGGVRFAPELPAPVADAIAGLPLGQLIKVGLRARWRQRLGLPAFSGIEWHVADPADQPPVWVFWPFGRGLATGFIGGETARRLERDGGAEAFARDGLAALLGADAVARTFHDGAIVTAWGADENFRGAYSVARPGQAGARATLASAALADGRLRFAGEACHVGQAGTVGGAWLSGLAAARALHATLR